MPYVYEKAESLVGNDPVGDKQCVALVREYARTPASGLWKEGKKVRGEPMLKAGTAIATFVDGKYPSNATGNHAALYLGQDAAGLWVVDQWKTSGTIRKRLLRFKGTDKQGKFIDPSNNGDAFSVID